MRLTGGTLHVVPEEYIIVGVQANAAEEEAELEHGAAQRRTSVSSRWHDDLASRMWIQYINYLHCSGRVTV